ncbi:MAG: anti-sigma factor [Caulobacteraceae bacterium]
MSDCEDIGIMLHGLLDGELDAVHAAEVEAHLAGCAECTAKYQSLQALRAAIRADGVRETAPAALRARLDDMLGAASGSGAQVASSVTPFSPRRARRPWPARMLAGGVIGALAASLALVAFLPTLGPGLPQELVEGHIRSLQAQHLVDVQTSDRHVVKPWFNGKIDFAPPVTDLADRGFPLAGGRLDYIEGRTVAALVYRRRAHVINLFVWPGGAPAAPARESRQGYTLVRWGRGGLVYWAVSDIDGADLMGFQKLFASATAG